MGINIRMPPGAAAQPSWGGSKNYQTPPPPVRYGVDGKPIFAPATQPAASGPAPPPDTPNAAPIVTPPAPNLTTPGMGGVGASAMANPGVQAFGPGGQPPPAAGEFSGPGPAEQAWTQHGQDFFAPTALDNWTQQNPGAFSNPGQGEQYWNQVQGGLMAPTNSEQTFQAFEKNKPQIDSSAGLAPYYDVAQKRAAEVINRGAAARGMYGSTAAMQQLGRSATDLSAEEANRNAAYKLQSLGEQRAWEGLGLQGANAADAVRTSRYGLGGQLSSQAQQLGLNRTEAGANVAATRSGLTLQGLSAGMAAAGGAQGAMATRGQNMVNNFTQPAEFMATIESGGYDKLIGADKQNMDDQIKVILSSGQNDVNTVAGQQAAELAKLGFTLDAMGNVVKAASTPGGLSNPNPAPAAPAPVVTNV